MTVLHWAGKEGESMFHLGIFVESLFEGNRKKVRYVKQRSKLNPHGYDRRPCVNQHASRRTREKLVERGLFTAEQAGIEWIPLPIEYVDTVTQTINILRLRPSY